MMILKINEGDNVAVAIETIPEGKQVSVGDDSITAVTEIPAGHKMALRDLEEGEAVIKYGYPIGHTQKAVKRGEWIHTHNLKTGLGDLLTYTYEPTEPKQMPAGEAYFDGLTAVTERLVYAMKYGSSLRLAV